MRETLHKSSAPPSVDDEAPKTPWTQYHCDFKWILFVFCFWWNCFMKLIIDFWGKTIISDANCFFLKSSSALLWHVSRALYAFFVVLRPFYVALRLCLDGLQPGMQKEFVRKCSKIEWKFGGLPSPSLTNFFWASSIFRLFSAMIFSSSSRFFRSSSYKVNSS